MKSLKKGIYRSRLGRPAQKEAAAFMSSLKDDEWIYKDDILGTEAHEIMLHENGLLEKKELKEILRALEALLPNYPPSNTTDFEDIHEFIESSITQKVGDELGGKIHTGRSRNDQVSVAIRMRMRTEINCLSKGILQFVEELLDKAEIHATTVNILYTHTQHAQIGTFGHYLLCQADIFLRDLERLKELYRRVNMSPLGAAAIGGTSMKIDRNRTATLLGFDGLVENSIDCISSRDVILECAAILALIATNLSRVAEDLILWSSSEFRYVELADEYASTSSIMPQKKNPCTIELVRGKAGIVQGHMMGLFSLTKGLLTGYNRDLQEMKPAIHFAFTAVLSSLEIMKGAFATLKVDEVRLDGEAKNSHALALDLAETLVTDFGFTFRESHKMVGQLVATSVKKGIALNRLSANEISSTARKVLGKQIRMKPEQLKKVFNPHLSIERRRSLGSPSIGEVKRMLGDRRQILDQHRTSYNLQVDRLEGFLDILSKRVKRYLGGT
ncbi:argininosuccinate lyase [Candidatus Bathyarchaeota archaeon]|nr:argininosuccinate lyase [Candidatus Bathyarchaeota archaeon]